VAIAPGLIMTPMSSILEATNAGVQNPEPLLRRALRGLAPRALREIIFGIGLNQLSEYCEERVPPAIENPVLRTAVGSLFAGTVSGYLSHVPHNLSALKLMAPKKTYLQHFQSLMNNWKPKLKSLPPNLQTPASAVCAVVLPRGMLIRTSQIVGSFVILNGLINVFKDVKPFRR
jgi:hypothetical protein